jgi:hypothetical protein
MLLGVVPVGNVPPAQHPSGWFGEKVINPFELMKKFVYVVQKKLNENPIGRLPDTWSSDSDTPVPEIVRGENVPVDTE